MARGQYKVSLTTEEAAFIEMLAKKRNQSFSYALEQCVVECMMKHKEHVAQSLVPITWDTAIIYGTTNRMFTMENGQFYCHIKRSYVSEADVRERMFYMNAERIKAL